MRILIATDNFYPNINGSANFTYELAKGLIENSHSVSVIAPARKFQYTLTKHQGIVIYGLPSLMIPKIIHPSRMRIPLDINPSRIKKIIQGVNPDVIHIQDHFMIGGRVAKIGRSFGIPVVGTNHFMPENFLHYLYPPPFAKRPLSKFAWKQFVDVYKHLDLITTPTKTAANLIKGLGLKNSIFPISCGVDLKRFSPKNNGDYLKSHYEIDNSKPVILFVGRLDKEKNINVLISAFSNILKSVDATLVIAGKGRERTYLANLAKKLGIEKKIIFTGFVPDKDLPFLYRSADLFAIASIAELQSIATLEAMASGLPVVAVNVMALPELVWHNKNGFLFDEGDSDTLATQIIKLLKNPQLRKKMSDKSLEIIKQHSLSNTIKNYEDIYRKAISKQS